jgi:fructose-1,6-bisphosphatase/inositol monophosphatase family enzyme
MSLTNHQLDELLILATKAATLAGEIISSAQGSQIKTLEKLGGENIASQVVTEIDIAAEKVILEVLTPTLEEYKVGLLTEETTDDSSRFDHDYFWCIDPLDGTLAFSRNEDGHSTSIALVAKDGTPIIGVVYDSKNNSLYSAIKNCGAFKNGKPLRVPAYFREAKNVTLLFDQSYLHYPTYEEQIKDIERKIKEKGHTSLRHHHLGGAVMNGITTIEMAPALYFKFPKKADGGGSLWDFAASSVIQSEAGGLNSDYFRKPLDLNRKNSTFMNHCGVIYVSHELMLDLIPAV